MPETKELSEILAISDDAPENLLVSKSFAAAIDTAIETVKPLVFSATDEGGKESKRTTASIRKYAKAVKAQVDGEYKDKTASLTEAKSLLVGKVKELNEIAKGIDDQQAERITKKLAEIRELLIVELNKLWDESEVRDEYKSDTACIDKAAILTSLTPKGVLAKKAKDYIAAVCAQNLKKQSWIDSRHALLENKCMKAGINSSGLTKEHIGEAFYGDDEAFNARVDELLVIEVTKKEQAKKQIEADKKLAVENALEVQQDEANRLAREEANKIALECAEQSKVTPKTEQPKAREGQQGLVDIDDNDEPVKQEPAPAKKQAVVNGKHQVQIQVTFTMAISDRVNDKAVQEHFLSQLPEKLKSSIDSLITRTV